MHCLATICTIYVVVEITLASNIKHMKYDPLPDLENVFNIWSGFYFTI